MRRSEIPISTLIVEVTEIENVEPHPNADRLELATVKGWQTVVLKGRYQPGDKVVYIPIDSLLPLELSDRIGVTQYLSKQRVRCARLRGCPSFGLVIPPDDPSWQVGTDVRETLGIAKYEPPFIPDQGDAETDHPLFTKYTEIENARNFPTVIEPAELVAVTEKIHGTQCRIGIVEGQWVAGSKGLRRRKPTKEVDGQVIEDLASMKQHLYWFPYTLESARNLIEHLHSQSGKSAFLYGEVYGRVQSLKYGLPNGIGFVAFDISVEGRYFDFADFLASCERFGVPTVPIIAQDLPYDLNTIKAMSAGMSVLAAQNGDPNQIREGIVVQPMRERFHAEAGRLILKYINDDYLFSSHVEHDRTDR